MQVRFSRVDWEYKSLFRISNWSKTHARTVVVELQDGAVTARGEGIGVFYHDETPETVLDQLSDVANDLRNGISRAELQQRLPPGGARNAADCALWELEAKRAGRRAWELAGLQSVHPIETDYTLGLDTPEAMARSAAALPRFRVLKIKLAGDSDVDRVRAIRAARPDAEIIVDANQGWNERQLHEYTPELAKLGVRLIEQPLAMGQDDALAAYDSPVPFCADESCQTSESLPALNGKYQYINIKLDKTGGLTEALRLARAAQAQGFKLMVGCMGGTSLSMAPAFIIGQSCEFVDLDGPLLLKSERPAGIRYEGGRMQIPASTVWG
jgi:L-alanine-DL-glutamate epimerase-like enolase superfamily enzyme